MDGQDVRPGFGIRRADLVDLLGRLTPAAEDRVRWPDDLLLDVTAYPVRAAVPDDLVTSARCVVRVGDSVVVCQAPDAVHIWPGGRRKPGESFEGTACREVHEETGWLVRPDQLTMLGFTHFRYVVPRPAGHPYPHPDFLQVVFCADSSTRDGDVTGEWRDVEGWEQSSRLCGPRELDELDLPAVQRVFLDACRTARPRS